MSEPAPHSGDLSLPPSHVAIIMDGNGRWARGRGMPRTAGHARGTQVVRDVVEAAPALGIRYLTLFGFSSENWRRPISEINDLMGLLRLYLRRELKELEESGVRLLFPGEREGLPRDVVALMDEAEQRTAANTRLVLMVALNYGARREIVLAARRLAARVAEGSLSVDDIDEACFAEALFHPDIPDPDLVIRTSGEKRLSNFLLWQSAYSELVFFDKTWPEFTADDLAAAVDEFQRRERRYGTTV